MSATIKTFYLPNDLVEWIKEQANRENRSASNFLAVKLEEIREREVAQQETAT